ncbi:MAG: ATP-grasp domain-containing protein [Clostridiales bacterium]|nr:ATP-grasp domain-containing protein [Clostridiales bacterium]
MNFVFISPHFPTNMWLYCRALHQNGVRVLGIADTLLENLQPELRNSLTDYCQVNNLEDGAELIRAIGYFTWRWGKMDWLESNNEYWLEQDAWLREQFNIETGPRPQQMATWRRKSGMKALYEKAGIPTAPWILADTLDNARAFAQKAGYPLIVKPDGGVGASGTYRIRDDRELINFFDHLPDQPYIIERCVFGEICSYDALIGSQGQPLYETGNVTQGNIMDFVNDRLNCVFYIPPRPADDLVEAGRRCVAAWGVRSRSIHFEFFRLDRDQEGLGKKGDVVGLEVNMRPSGGYTSDMINYAGSVDIYRMWADMICYDHVHLNPDRQTYYCVFLGRRDFRSYVHPNRELERDWQHRLVMSARMPRALADTMGDQVYLARCLDKAELDAFVDYGCKET